MDLTQFREIIREKPLLEENIPLDPMDFLEEWIRDAIDAGIRQPNAMNLATVSELGKPKSRVVLLKEILNNKITFFTNYNSPKAIEIKLNNYVSLNFLWFDINRQIRVEGRAEKTTLEYSKNYFYSRPRDSQIAAIISAQSKVVKDRHTLEELYENFSNKYKDKEIPFPDFWGGYEITPTYLEFWQGRTSRLHDRIVYQKENSMEWKIFRLNP